MNVKFGASLLSWITPNWTPKAGKYAIEKTSIAGFDLIEILLPNAMEFDAIEVKKQLRNYQFDAVCSLNSHRFLLKSRREDNEASGR